MLFKTLQQKILASGSPVDMLRNAQVGPYVVPVPGEFSNWRDEQRAWRETAVLFDQSFHMTELNLEGPDLLRLLSSIGVNSFENFLPNKAKQFVACNHDGYVIGDAILFYLAENKAKVAGRPPVINWLEFNAKTGGYEIAIDRDERGRSSVHVHGRRTYRYQVQGPHAETILEKLNGRQLPPIEFFNMGEITIAGHRVRALRHGMSGAPGLEIWGPADEAAEVKAALLSVGRDFGLLQSGSRAYISTCLENGWIPSPMPAVYTGELMKPYREWLPADGFEGLASLGGSFYSDRIEDYYLTPYDLGYGSFVKFDHDFIGTPRVGETRRAAAPPESHVGLEQRRCPANLCLDDRQR
jgi:vanillate/3-O-methylgallate O-demethylase